MRKSIILEKLAVLQETENRQLTRHSLLLNFETCSSETFTIPPMNKVVASAEEAIQDVFDGATIMVGGFGLCGMPENLIRALARKASKNLTTISNNVGVDGFGMGLLLANGQIRRHIGTYVGENKLLEEMVLKGKCSLTWFRRERFPSAFAREARVFRLFLRQPALARSWRKAKRRANSTAALRDGTRAESGFRLRQSLERRPLGNLVYRKTARNFNPMMATAAKVTIAEVEELVEAGELEPDMVHTPSVFVKRIFQGELL